jgi:hypothetical protein
VKTDTANKPQPSEEVQVKAIDLGTSDNSKTTLIGAGLVGVLDRQPTKGSTQSR